MHELAEFGLVAIVKGEDGEEIDARGRRDRARVLGPAPVRRRASPPAHVRELRRARGGASSRRSSCRRCVTAPPRRDRSSSRRSRADGLTDELKGRLLRRALGRVFEDLGVDEDDGARSTRTRRGRPARLRRVARPRSPTPASASPPDPRLLPDPLGVRADHVPHRVGQHGNVIASFSPGLLPAGFRPLHRAHHDEPEARDQEEPQGPAAQGALPGRNIKIFYQKDFRKLLFKFGIPVERRADQADGRRPRRAPTGTRAVEGRAASRPSGRGSTACSSPRGDRDAGRRTRRAITADYAGRDLVLVTVLRGGVFFLADLCRRIDLPLHLDFMAVSPYAGAPGGLVRITKDLDEDIEGRRWCCRRGHHRHGSHAELPARCSRRANPRASRCARCSTRTFAASPTCPSRIAASGYPTASWSGYGLDLAGRCATCRTSRRSTRESSSDADGSTGADAAASSSRGCALPRLVARHRRLHAHRALALFDALYMTVITVGTVGFREVHAALDGPGRRSRWCSSSPAWAPSASRSARSSIHGRGALKGILEGRRMTSVSKLPGHHIVAGIGRVGSVVARGLRGRGAPFVVVDSSEDGVSRARGARLARTCRATPPKRRRCAAGITRAPEPRDRARHRRGQPVRHGDGAAA